MELRCFFPISIGLNIKDHEMLKNQSWSEENRIDHYINLHSPEYGLKLRGKKQLEIKIRKEVIGHVEQWIKVVLSKKIDKSYSKSSIVKALKSSQVSAPAIPLVDHFNGESDVYTLKKVRYQCMAMIPGSDNDRSIRIEQVDFEVFIGENSLGNYRSINVEGNTAERLEGFFNVLIPDWNQMNGMIIGGYPEFIETLDKDSVC